MTATVKTVLVGVASLAVFGLVLYVIRKLPDSAATRPLKMLGAVASGCPSV